MKHLLTLLLFSLALSLAAEWSSALSLPGGGYWNRRIPLRITNSGPALAGQTVDLPVNLAGVPVDSLRLTREDGAELLYLVSDKEGVPVTRGVVPEGATLSIPLECAANAAATCYLYFGNDKAWRVPEYLYLGVAGLNGDLEDGLWSMPDNWKRRGEDAAHRLIRDNAVARSGRYSIRAEADAGAAPSWFGAFFDTIAVRAGEAYEVSAWTRAETVEGIAGWYVHVFDKEGKILVNKMIEAGKGSFDWKRGSLTFEVPVNGVRAAVGTVLRGSGKAWFDLVSVKRQALPVNVEVLPVETKALQTIGRDASWHADAAYAWRAPLTVRNLAAKTATRQYAFDLRLLKNQAAKLLGFTSGVRCLLVDPVDSRIVREFNGSLDDDLNLELTLPAETEKTFYLYLDSRPAAKAAGAKDAEVEYIGSPRNLLGARNGNMEEGEGALPAFWRSGEEGRDHSDRFTAERVKGGVNGDWCLKLSVPDSVAKPGWVGWRQRIPVKPGTTYIYTGFIKTENTDTTIVLHGHFLDKNGRMITAFNAPGDGTLINNINEDWMRYSSPFTTPVDCAMVDVHLTMNGHGTIWHDAISICEFEESGVTGAFESRQGEKSCVAVWEEPVIVKVFRHDIEPPVNEQASRLFAAANSREALQLAVRPCEDAELVVEVAPPQDAKGNRLPVPALFRSGFVPIDQPGGNLKTTKPAWLRLNEFARGTDGWAGYWPDPLIPVRNGKFPARAGETEGLFFDFTVPSGAVPGVYRTEIRLTQGGRSVARSVEIKVWKFRQPDRKKTLALFDTPNPNVYGLDKDDAAPAMMRFLASYDLSPGVMPRAFQPVFRLVDGKVAMETERFDRMCKLLFEELQVNMIYVPSHFYAGGWASGISGMFDRKYGTPEFDRVWRESYRLFVDHLSRKGWRDRFIYYVADEPHNSSKAMMDGLAHLADMAREIAPDIPVYSSTWVYMPELEGHLSMWGIGENGRFPLEKMRERMAKGDRFMFTTDGHFGVDTPFAGVERMLPQLAFRYGLEGYEFWSTDHYTYNPWEFGWGKDITQSLDGGKSYSRFRFPNGDGYILYPGRDLDLKEPIPSLRMLYMRMGISDNELYYRLAEFEKAGNPAAKVALDKVRSYVSIPTHPNRSTSLYRGDPAGFLKARVEAGEALESLIR